VAPLLSLTLLVLTASVPVRADEAHQFLHNTNPANPLFECNQKTIGQVACQAGNRCKCGYNAFGDAMRGLPAGYRWDCGLEQGSCLVDVPAETKGDWGNAPPVPPAPPPQVVVPYPGTTGTGTGSGGGAGR
jgi:hypothetical protein